MHYIETGELDPFRGELLSPREGAQLGLGTHHVAGLAWAGEERVTRVDVSSDGGRTWQAAHLKGLQQPYSWCQWEALWTVTSPGDYTLMTRAHTESGQAQPFDYDAGNLGYIINVIRGRAVSVRAMSAADCVRAAGSGAIAW